MYDRAPRSLTLPSDSTGHSVGPGSYEAPEFGPTKYGLYHLVLTWTIACLRSCYLLFPCIPDHASSVIETQHIWNEK